MPISPTALLDILAKTEFDIPKICSEIDDKLKLCKLESDLIFTVDVNYELPQYVIDKICNLYRNAGWASSSIGLTQIEHGFIDQLHAAGNKITRFRFSV